MEKRRTPYAVAAAVVSLGLLAACSDDSDITPEPPTEETTPAPSTDVTPAPAQPPAEASPSTSSGSSGAGNTMPPPVEERTQPMGGGSSDTPGTSGSTDPVPSTSPSSSIAPGFTEKLAMSGQELQLSARNVAYTVGEKAGEWRQATGERMTRVGQAIRAGAVRADETIQASFERGGEPTRNTPIAMNERSVK